MTTQDRLTIHWIKPTTVDVLTSGHYITEAEAIGLPDGEWPDVIAWNEPETVMFWRSDEYRIEDTVEWVLYYTAGQGRSIKVFTRG